MKRFTRGHFDLSPETTLGIEYDSRFMVIKGEKTQLQIWDTMGQEQHMSLAPSYYQNALGVLLVYDLTRKSSYDSLV